MTLTKSTLIPFLFLLVAVSLLPIVAAENPALVNIWMGNVTIGTNTSTNWAIIGAYESGALDVTTRVGDIVASNTYRIDVECTAGNTMFLKVWGINATWQTCANSFKNDTNLTVSLVASGGTCYYSSACAGSYVCCSGTSEINNGVTAGSCTSTCAAATTTTSGGGSSSGGGGGGGTALASETSTAFTVSGSTTTGVSFTKSSDIAVEKIELETTASASIGNGQITVKETTVSQASSSAIETSTSKVYKYLSITKANIKDSDFQKAKIRFEVPVSWLTSNNIAPSTVKLNRWVDSKWVALTTTLVSSDSSKYVYEAETPGFSIFAISGEQKLSAFQIIDTIRDFYAGTSKYTAFEIIDLIRQFYA